MTDEQLGERPRLDQQKLAQEMADVLGQIPKLEEEVRVQKDLLDAKKDALKVVKNRLAEIRKALRLTRGKKEKE